MSVVIPRIEKIIKKKQSYRDQSKIYYAKNRPKILEYTRQYHKDNPLTDKQKAQKLYNQRKRRTKNPLQKRRHENKYRMRLKERMFHVLGHVCVRCGLFDKRALQFDHINGGGNKARREKKHVNQRRMMAYYVKHPEESKLTFQILCASCNWIKRYENNEAVKRETSVRI